MEILANVKTFASVNPFLSENNLKLASFKCQP